MDKGALQIMVGQDGKWMVVLDGKVIEEGLKYEEAVLRFIDFWSRMGC